MANKNSKNKYLNNLLPNFAQVIGKARVPIIKFVEKRSNVAFDIRFGILLMVLGLSNLDSRVMFMLFFMSFDFR